MAQYEKTQTGNPHQLTIRQHLLPRKTIARFVGRDGMVHVHIIKGSIVRRLKPENPMFCTMRSWDQRAESVLSKSIEDRYQIIADRLVDQSLTSLAAEMHHAINEMYLLWRFRCLCARNPPQDLRVNGVAKGSDLNIDEQERLEKGGVLFLRPNGSLPGRVVAGMMLQSAIDREWANGAHKMRWGALRTDGLGFLVPDAFIEQPILPVAPNVCLAAGALDAELTLEKVALVNREAIRSANKYWFAHDINCCPVPRAPVL